MSSLTDRYVHAVTEQLPPQQRDDIARELRGTIQDTVAAGAARGDDPGAAERRALTELGPPTRLADSYRGEGRYLIGPRVYGPWLRTLKALLALVPALVAVIVLVVGVLDGNSLGEAFGDAIGGGLSAALQVAFWVTLGFVIAERTGSEDGLLQVFGDDDGWDPESLPEPQKRQVTWGDAIFALIVNAFLLVLLLSPLRAGGQFGDYHLGQVFTDSAYALRWVMAIGVAVSLLSSIFVLVRGRWEWPTAIANALGNLVFIAPVLWLASRDDLFAWDTIPTSWVGDSGSIAINESATLWGSVAVVVAIVLWDTIDGLWNASRQG